MPKHRHQPPAFQVEVRPQPRLQAAIAGLGGSAGLSAVAAALAHDLAFWPLLALLPACVWMAWQRARVCPRKLQWDGQTWRLGLLASLDPGVPVALEVLVDLGSWMLLRSRTAERGWFGRTYLPLSSADLGASWGLLRATLYSARPPALLDPLA